MRFRKVIEESLNLGIQSLYDTTPRMQLLKRQLEHEYKNRCFEDVFIHEIVEIVRDSGDPVLQNYSLSGDGDVCVTFEVECEDFAPGTIIFGATLNKTKEGMLLFRKPLSADGQAFIVGTVAVPKIDIYNDKDVIHCVIERRRAGVLDNQIVTVTQILNPILLHMPAVYVQVKGGSKGKEDLASLLQKAADYTAVFNKIAKKEVYRDTIYPYTSKPAGKLAGNVLTDAPKEGGLYKVHPLPAGDHSYIRVTAAPDDQMPVELTAAELQITCLNVYIRQLDHVVQMDEHYKGGGLDDEKIFWDLYVKDKVHPL